MMEASYLIFILLLSIELCYAQVSLNDLKVIRRLKSIFNKRDNSNDDFGSVFHYHRAESRSIATDRHIGCVQYRSAGSTFRALNNLGIPYSPMYSSLKENIYCIHMKLTNADINTIRSHSSTLSFDILESLPYLTNIDSSINHLHHYLSRSYDEVNASLLSHPLSKEVHDNIAKGKVSPLGISILFDRSNTPFKSQQLLQSWKTQWLSNEKGSYSSLCRKLYWHAEESKKYSLPSLPLLPLPPKTQQHQHARNLFPRPKPSSSSSVGVFNHSLWFALEEEVLQLLDPTITITNTINTIINKKKEPVSMKSYCQLEQLTIKMQRYGMFISFSKELTDVASMQHSHTKRQLSHCLAYLLPTILTTVSVVSVGITFPPRVMNNLARGIVQSGSIVTNTNEIYSNLGLTGENVVIGISDTGIDEYHCYFHDAIHGFVPRSSIAYPYSYPQYRKIIQYVNYSGSSGDYNSGHGSHVSGSLAGYCNTDDAANTYHGMARNAKLAFFDIGIKGNSENLVVPDDLSKELYPCAYHAGARIHSNSWGGGYFFDSYSLATDEYLYQHQDFALFFAAGNAGSLGIQTIVSPGLAKNTITIGCSETVHDSNQQITNVAYFSSQGPTFDGRMKPDILAPGHRIMSVKAQTELTPKETCSMEYKMGTSMATPVAAGNTALIIQYFQDTSYWVSYCNPLYQYCLNGAFTPSGVLLKALVLHAGHPMTLYNAGSRSINLQSSLPDIYQGYGRYQLSNILPILPYSTSPFQLFVQEHQLHSYEIHQYTIDLMEGSYDPSLPLKITIVWYDPPNEYITSRLLLHDLDLVVRSPIGQMYYGNNKIITSSNDHSNTQSSTTRDEINPNEQITIMTPISGQWTVFVQAKQLKEEYQQYAIVITTNGIITVNPITTTLNELQVDSCYLHDTTAMTTVWDANTAKMKVEVSLWAKITEKGWQNNEYYTLTTFNQDPNTVITQYTFHEHYNSKVNDHCLSVNTCYLSHLIIPSTATSNKHGVQLTIPQCYIHLSAFTSQSSFCFIEINHTLAKNVQFWTNDSHFTSSYSPITTTTTRSTTLVPGYTHYYDHHYDLPTFYNTNTTNSSHTAELMCISHREQSLLHSPYHWMVVNLLLYEGAGAGWIGGYYAFFPKPSLNTLEDVYSNTLIWGVEEIQPITIPFIPNQCYYLQFSYLIPTEDYPALAFLDSYHMESLLSTGNKKECHLYLNSSISLASFCLPATPYELTVITFYTQSAIGGSNIGQSYVNTTAYLASLENPKLTHAVGQCFLELSYISRASLATSTTGVPGDNTNTNTNIPTSFPSSFPSLFPTTNPTTPPTTNNNNSTDNNTDNTNSTNSTNSTDITNSSSSPTFLPTTLLPTIIPTTLPTRLPTISPSSSAPVSKRTIQPITYPTIQPTIPATFEPTLAPTHFMLHSHYNFTGCFHDCAGYPQDFTSTTIVQETCLFLLSDIYHTCDSFAISYGYCDLPTCIPLHNMYCTRETWCYYAMQSMTTCIGDYEKGKEWIGAEIITHPEYKQCIASYLMLPSQTDNNNDNNDGNESNTNPSDSSSSSSSNTQIVLTVIGACLAFLCLILLFKYLYQLKYGSCSFTLPLVGAGSPGGRGEYQLSDTSSHHGTTDGNDEPHSSSSSSSSSGGDNTILSLLSKTFISNTHSYPRTTVGNSRGNSRGSGEYEMVATPHGEEEDVAEMVRNPFTIHHHESDDEEEGGGNGNGNGNGNGDEEEEEVEVVLKKSEQKPTNSNSNSNTDSSGYAAYYYLKAKEEEKIVKSQLQKQIIQSATITTTK